MKLLVERVTGAHECALAAHLEDPAGDAGNDGKVVARIAAVVDGADRRVERFAEALACFSARLVAIRVANDAAIVLVGGGKRQLEPRHGIADSEFVFVGGSRADRKQIEPVEAKPGLGRSIDSERESVGAGQRQIGCRRCGKRCRGIGTDVLILLRPGQVAFVARAGIDIEQPLGMHRRAPAQGESATQRQARCHARCQAAATTARWATGCGARYAIARGQDGRGIHREEAGNLLSVTRWVSSGKHI